MTAAAAAAVAGGRLGRRTLLAAAAASAAAPLLRAQTAAVKIGVLNDMSGPYRDIAGPLSIACTRLAAQEFAEHGFNIEVINADHENKPELGAAIARRWFDTEGVDAIVDVPTSSVALAVSAVCRAKNKVCLTPGRARRT